MSVSLFDTENYRVLYRIKRLDIMPCVCLSEFLNLMLELFALVIYSTLFFSD